MIPSATRTLVRLQRTISTPQKCLSPYLPRRPQSQLAAQTPWNNAAPLVPTLIYPEKPKVDAYFLRDSCRCSGCVDESTQKRIHVSSLPWNLTASSDVTPDGELQVTWQNGASSEGQTPHVSRYSRRYLEQLLGEGAGSNADLETWRAVMWDNKTLSAVKDEIFHDYSSYMTTAEGLNGVVDDILKYGLAFIRNVPEETSSVKTLAERIGPLRNTFYGETWDVQSVVNPTNVAYTSGFLDFHQDLLYMAHPPDLQFLHVMRASTGGGESMFVDGAHAVQQLQARPDWTDTMKGLQAKVTYRYANDGQWYQHSRPTLQKGGRSVVIPKDTRRPLYPDHYDAVNWSPPFQGPFGLSAAKVLHTYTAAVRALREQLEAESNIFELRMEPGTCVVFNNRRIMHARRAFDPSRGGERLLRGAYVDWDPLMSRWREARRMRGDITPGDDVRPA